MGSCAAPSAKGDDKFITTDYLQQCPCLNSPHIFATVNQIKIIYLLGLAFAGFLMLNKRKT
ncbi:replication initiator protein [Escherichia coli]|nr:replication initiator protein [Escherichia coli]MQS74458.1 replication initiator protein [Escherichia coli]MQS87950.1 replication initiator protein [Escherichia coli]